MPVEKLIEFATAGAKNTTGLILEDGFPSNIKPARQWVNWLFNSLCVKVNELIDQLETPENRVKPGLIMMWPKNTAPSGYLECAGQAISRTTYADLFDELGTSYGVGDGTTTFNLPDLRGEFVRGWDHGRGVDAGRTIGSNQIASSVFMGDPTSTDTAIAGLYNELDNDSATIRAALNGEPSTADDANIRVVSTLATTDDPASVASTTMSIRPRNIAMMFVIKT